MIEYISLLGFSLIVRLLPVRNNTIDFDTYGHLYFVSEIKRQNMGIWKGLQIQCWKSENFHHPFMWHWLVSFFPINQILKYQKWINGSMDALFTVFLYALLLKIDIDDKIAFLGALLYLFTPMWFSSISMGPRVNSFTPRLFSELSFNILFVIILCDFGIPVWIKTIIAISLSFVILLSSKFGLQALLFLSPIMSLLIGSIFPILAVSGGILLGIILSKGRIVPMLNRQLAHLYEYYFRNISGMTAISDRNQFSKIFVNSDKSKVNFRIMLMRLISENSYTAVIIKMPIYIVALILILFEYLSQKNEINILFVAPILSATITYILINRPRFLFLGEAERYLNHISIFILITSIKLASQSSSLWILWSLVAYGVVFWFIELVIIGRFSSQKNRQKADKIIEEYLISLKSKQLILSYPYHNFCVYRIMLCTFHRSIFPYHMNESTRTNFVERFEFKYPYLNLKKLDELEKETGCSTVIIDKKALLSQGLGDWRPLEKWKKIDLNQSVYDIYER